MKKQRPPSSWDDVPIVIDLHYVSQFILDMNFDYLKQLSNRGKFPAFRASERCWRVKKDDLLKWIDTQKVQKGV